MSRKCPNRSGFTIVELIVVVVVIGILSSVVFVSLSDIRKKANDSLAQVNLKQLEDAINSYHSLNGGNYSSYYYSGVGDGYNETLNFRPSQGAAIDLATDGTDYCIRSYSQGGNKNSVINAFVKESRSGVCAYLTPATDAYISISTPVPISVNSGYNHNCSLFSEGRVYCWGYNYYGQLGNGTSLNALPTPVEVGGNLSGEVVKSISVGHSHTCALTTSSVAYCWGYNASGRLGDNSATQRVLPVLVNTGGALFGLTIKSISAGYDHTCAIALDDNAYCWGEAGSGQLGYNSTIDQLSPVAVDTSGVLSGLTIKSISAGASYTCVIASDNNAYCWGAGASGRLGNSAVANSLVPVAVSKAGVLSNLSINVISAGTNTTCVIASDNNAYCWGEAGYGQLGNGSTTDQTVPVAVSKTGVLNGISLKNISSGSEYGSGSTCAISLDDKAYCWGYNLFGQLGNNSLTNSLVPISVDNSGPLNGKEIISISNGNGNTCAVTSEGNIYCWGYRLYGQLGYGELGHSKTPVTISEMGAYSGKTINKINAGTDHTCVIASDNNAYCWGQGSSGRLGNGSSLINPIPTAVSKSGYFSDKSINDLSTGVNHSCAIASDNNAYCWGEAGYGQLGNGSTTDRTTPVPVTATGALLGLTIKAISVGSTHTCAIASDNNAYCWGYNSTGQLGNGLTSTSTTPVLVTATGVLSGLTIKAISSGNTHTCAIASDNNAYCWGAGASGRLGNSAVANSLVPVAVTNSGVLAGLTIKSISAGTAHTCAIASNNKAYCWGEAGNGELGNNSTTDRSEPYAVTVTGVLSGLDILSIASGSKAGTAHTCVIASNNKAYCWGYNGFGQLGNNSLITSRVPVMVDTSGVLNGKTLSSVSVGGDFSCALDDSNTAYCWGTRIYGQLGDGFELIKVPTEKVSF